MLNWLNNTEHVNWAREGEKSMKNTYTELNENTIRHVVNTIYRQADWHIESTGAGVTSLAWLAVHQTDRLIVRAMPLDSKKPVTYPVEMAILEPLFSDGQLVPEPIAHSQTYPLADIPFDWAITRHIEGETIGYEYFPPDIAMQLGKLLATYHALPTHGGWGWVQVNNNQFSGTEKTAQAGACERWDEYPLWPLDGSTLEKHVVSQIFPDEVPQLEALVPQLIEMANQGQPVICHSDLHGDHIYVSDDQLSGLIDFGDACILPAAWDLAIIAFYYGWDILDIVLTSYTDDDNQRTDLLHQVYHLGIILDLNKMQKAFHKYPQRLARRNENPFFKQCLVRLSS